MGPVGGELYSCILLPTATRRYILRIGRRSVCLSAVRRAAGPGGGLALGAGGHPHNYTWCRTCKSPHIYHLAIQKHTPALRRAGRRGRNECKMGHLQTIVRRSLGASGDAAPWQGQRSSMSRRAAAALSGE